MIVVGTGELPSYEAVTAGSREFRCHQPISVKATHYRGPPDVFCDTVAPHSGQQMLTSVIDIALYSSLACAGFVAGRWIGARYEPGVAHYVMGGVLACTAVYVLAAPQVSLNPRWVSLTAGAYVGLSLGSFLRILWREEHHEREREISASALQPRDEPPHAPPSGQPVGLEAELPIELV